MIFKAAISVFKTPKIVYEIENWILVFGVWCLEHQFWCLENQNRCTKPQNWCSVLCEIEIEIVLVAQLVLLQVKKAYCPHLFSPFPVNLSVLLNRQFNRSADFTTATTTGTESIACFYLQHSF